MTKEPKDYALHRFVRDGWIQDVECHYRDTVLFVKDDVEVYINRKTKDFCVELYGEATYVSLKLAKQIIEVIEELD